jgi:exodeoxyribonuclease V alpha subunit
MDQIFGTIERITFRSDETGFTVARLKQPRKKDLTTIVGSLATLHPGEEVRLQGEWKQNPQHGLQFAVTQCSIEQPKDLKGIEKYLSSGWIKGIGPSFAKKIVGYFKEETLEILDSNPDRLSEVPGVGQKRVTSVKASWREGKALREVMLFLQTYDISITFAKHLYRQFGEECVARVKENPYTLAQEIRGIGFKKADQMAFKMGFPKEAETRLETGMLHVLYEAASEGHTTLPIPEFFRRSQEMLSVNVEKTYPTLIEKGWLVEEERSGIKWVATRPHWMTEKGVAHDLKRLIKAPCKLRSVQLDKAVDWAETTLKLTFAEQQKEAIKAGLSEKLHIITGGPGTGKSTITKALVRVTEKLSRKIVLAAPTGRAAKRLSEITKKEALTLHALLQYDFKAGGFKRNRGNPLDADLIILDEVSMVDLSLMYHFIKAVPDHARLLLIGDVHQLPSVGAGNVLADLIDSHRISTTTLNEIFRQAAGSSIITNAHKIQRGEFPHFNADKKSDCFFVKKEQPEELLEEVLSLVSKRLPKSYRLNPMKHIQVLAPMRRGVIGIQNFNQRLQQVLNPQTEGISYMGTRFSMGDKVMQLRNNYEKEVYNGDIGYIEAIDDELDELLVSFGGKSVAYLHEELDELTLAYACSVHKYQGSEAPCVVIPFHTSHFMMLQRNVLYTAVTRGKRLVVIVGTGKAIGIALNNQGGLKRHTALKERVQELLHYAKA